MAATSRGVARLVVVCLASAWLVVGFQSTAHACSCVTSTLTEVADGVDGVFVGTTRAVVPGRVATRTLNVTEVFKGDPDALIALNTGEERVGVGTSCDFTVRAGRTVIVFADGSGQYWMARGCDHPANPTQANLDELEQAFGPPHAPNETPTVEPGVETGSGSGPVPWWAYAVVAGGVVLIGGLVVSSRRR